MKSSIAIFCLQNQLAAWRLGTAHAPVQVPIERQERLQLSTPPTPQEMAQACADVAERLQDAGFDTDEVHWILDAAGHALWQASLPQLNQIFTQYSIWQALSWSWLAERFGLQVDKPWTMPTKLADTLLPWLVSLDASVERQKIQQMLADEHQTKSDQLFGERTRLQQENDHLRAQNAALQQVDAERLVSFLPALFPRVFTVLGAADLALLCGRIEPLAIANPYPEPSEETLRTLQKQFRALPQQLQQQIVRFVAHLPQRHKLQPRPEMRELVLTLEEN